MDVIVANLFKQQGGDIKYGWYANPIYYRTSSLSLGYITPSLFPKNNINLIGKRFPWLSFYGVSYISYSIILTLSFVYYSNFDTYALYQFACLSCTVLPLGISILTLFLWQSTQSIRTYQIGLFDATKKVPICANIDLLSLILSCLLVISLCHHIFVLVRVVCSLFSETSHYLRHPHGKRGILHSNLSQSTAIRSRGNRRLSNALYVYKSEESESASQEEIEVGIRMPIYQHQHQSNQLTVPTGDDQEIHLNKSGDVHRTFTGGSVSFDI